MTASSDPADFDFSSRLAGKTVLVVGGTGGLGSAASVLLARDGARVVAGFRSDSEAAKAFRDAAQARWGAEIILVEGDICDAQVRQRYLEAAEAGGGKLYGLVCFSGDPARVKFDAAGPNDLIHSLENNYVYPLLLARDAREAMKRSGEEGSIVLISSMQAVSAFDSSVNYAGAKAALHHVCRILAKQWGGPGGVRVNVVAPGVNRAGMALQSIASGKYDFFVEEKIIARFGRPEDVARVVRLLLEPDAYITGQIVTVDGGLTLRRARP